MAQQTYTFRIKTKDGNITSLVKQGTSQADAEQKLRTQYPNCTILDVQVK